MKTINKFLGLVLGSALLLVSCQTKDIKADPSPKFEGAAQVYFPTTSISKEYDPADGITSADITVARKDSIGELTVAIKIEEADSIFTIPASVTFADSVKEAKLHITFPGAVDGITYSAIITVDDATINPYSATISKCTFAFTNLAWTKADFPSVWVDGSWSGAFSIDPVPVWYVDYEYVIMTEGAKYRFSKPYASHPSNWDKTTKKGTPDRYGVYDGFPANYPTDYKKEDADNAVCTIDAAGKASWTRFNTGVDWSYGYFYVGNIIKDYTASEESYPLGSYKSNVISFPENSMYLYIPKYGAYPGGACTIYLDGKKYQEDHSVKHIADFEDGFNDTTEMKWVEAPAPTAIFQSEAFAQEWDQPFRQAVDIDSISGEQSEFKNLFSLPDLYTEGYCLAFYWDLLKGEITIPAKQPTGLFFAGKEIFMGPSSEASTTEIVSVSGTFLFKYTFAIALTTEDDNLIGEYKEVFYMGDEIVWSVQAFVGNFDYAGVSAFDGTDVESSVSISQVDDSTVIIEGLHQYSSGVYGVFDSISSTLSIVPQLQDSIGKYDITFLTIDLSDNPSATAPIILKASIDGSVSVDWDNTEAMGWIIYSKAAGGSGLLVAVYDFNLTPSAAPAAPAKKAVAGELKAYSLLSKIGYQPKTGKQISTDHFRIQGKVNRHAVRTNTVPML